MFSKTKELFISMVWLEIKSQEFANLIFWGSYLSCFSNVCNLQHSRKVEILIVEHAIACIWPRWSTSTNQWLETSKVLRKWWQVKKVLCSRNMPWQSHIKTYSIEASFYCILKAAWFHRCRFLCRYSGSDSDGFLYRILSMIACVLIRSMIHEMTVGHCTRWVKMLFQGKNPTELCQIQLSSKQVSTNPPPAVFSTMNSIQCLWLAMLGTYRPSSAPVNLESLGHPSPLVILSLPVAPAWIREILKLLAAPQFCREIRSPLSSL